MILRIPQNFRSPAVGDDQARLRGYHFSRHIGWNGKIKPITEVLILRPFVIGPEVGKARFYFDRPDRPSRPNRHHIDSAAGSERQFRYGGESKRPQHPADPTLNGCRSRRLSSIDNGELDLGVQGQRPPTCLL
jgi:hypothetical protein